MGHDDATLDALRRTARAVGGRHGLSPGCGEAELLGAVSRLTGVRAVVHAAVDDGAPLPARCGVSAATAVHTDRIEILVDATATGLYRRALVGHEVGHLLMGHHSSISREEIARAVAPDVSPDLARAFASAGTRFLRRSFETRQEREAEVFATWVVGSPTAATGLADLVRHRS